MRGGIHLFSPRFGIRCLYLLFSIRWHAWPQLRGPRGLWLWCQGVAVATGIPLAGALGPLQALLLSGILLFVPLDPSTIPNQSGPGPSSPAWDPPLRASRHPWSLFPCLWLTWALLRRIAVHRVFSPGCLGGLMVQ